MPLALQPASYPLLINVRTYIPNVIDCRAGIVQVNNGTLGTSAHSLKRLNDPLPGASNPYKIVVGVDTNLFMGTVAAPPTTTLFVSVDTGYSGNPLSFTDYRPPNSPESWLYVADSLQMRKVRTDGTVFPQGVHSPNFPPTIEFGPPLSTIVDESDGSGATWTAGGTATLVGVATRFNQNITYIVYDSGTTGWASIALTTHTNPRAQPAALQPSMRVNLNNSAEKATVQAVFPGLSQTTIAAILYDSGTTGLATVQPALSTLGVAVLPARRPGTGRLSVGDSVTPQNAVGALGLQPGALVLVNYGGGTQEVVEILSVSTGPGGFLSFRANFASTHAAGETLIGLSTFRAFTTTTLAPGEPVKGFVESGTLTTGTGFFTIAEAVDLSIVGGQRASQPSDEIHLSVNFDLPANLTEGRLLFDVDSGTNDFAHNYYYVAFRPSDLTQAVSGTETQVQATTTAVQNAQIDTFTNLWPSGYYQTVMPTPTASPAPQITPASSQAATGTAQYTEFRFKLSDFTRVGSDSSVNWANVAAVRVQFTVTGNTAVKFGEIYLKGSYGPDVGVVGSDYFYRFRRRSLQTGAKSNPSPYQRNGARPHNQRMQITMPGDATEGNLFDVFRYGGAVPADAATGLVPWLLVGTAANPGVGFNATFIDDYADSDILNAEVLEFDNYVPYPTIDIPRTGTCNVVGTMVSWVSGDTFNTNWEQGSIIQIGGIPYTLFAKPYSTTLLEIIENAGAQTGALFYLQNPTLAYRNLYAQWGPFNGDFLACGDLYQPGVLFVTKTNAPDAAPPAKQVEVTAPSEPLINGCMYGNGASFSWSDQRMFQLFPSQDLNLQLTGAAGAVSAASPYVAVEVPGSKGLFAPWWFAVGRRIYYGTKDGIYATSGETPQSITDPYLSLLFPHDGRTGVDVTLGAVTFFAPDFTLPAKLRLFAENNHVKFAYRDLGGNDRVIVYNELLGVWSNDRYDPLLTVGALYSEEGAGVNRNLVGTGGDIYQEAGDLETASTAGMQVLMPQVGANYGYMTGRDGYVGVEAAVPLTLTVNADGVPYVHTVPPTPGAAYLRVYVPLQAVKGKSWQWNFQSASNFRLWLKDCEFRQKQWGAADFGKFQPFLNFVRELQG